MGGGLEFQTSSGPAGAKTRVFALVLVVVVSVLAMVVLVLAMVALH